MIPKAQKIKASVNRWEHIRLKSLCTATEKNQQNAKAKYRTGEIFANHVSDKGLVSKITETPKQFDLKKIGRE